MKGKSVETKFEKSSVIRQPNAFKSQRQSILGKPAIFSDSLAKKDFSKSKTVTKQNVSNDFSKPVTAQILPQNMLPIVKNTNVIAPGIVSRPQLKSNHLEDRVMSNNSQGKKQEVEDHRRKFKFSNNKTSVTACNDSLNAKTLNVNFLVEIVLFIVESGCSKHMIGNLKLLTNFLEKFLGTVKFGNDQIAPILGIRMIWFKERLTTKVLVALNLYSIDSSRPPTPNQLLNVLKQHRLKHVYGIVAIYLNFGHQQLAFKNNIVKGLPKLKFVKDHLFSSCGVGERKKESHFTLRLPQAKDVTTSNTWTYVVQCGKSIK
ncbi:hypothetical protein Tco_0937874 [Tanacetum coccineum]|uniref:Retrovirus-related Pol polyprotein from transposon TNT 1-94-like beta-barrel domain-containing protein n=1 Tax=Tanacetum coccineum TaxID=301880 RepID=A0ABQ5DLR2_9ASTR